MLACDVGLKTHNESLIEGTSSIEDYDMGTLSSS